MMTSQILKSVDFPKTQNSKYLKNETFFLQIKILLYCKKYFCSGGKGYKIFNQKITVFTYHPHKMFEENVLKMFLKQIKRIFT